MEKALTSEVYKQLSEYPSHFVSNLGNVKSKNGVLNPYKTKAGYLRVSLWKNGKPKYVRVHQLVAMAFLDHQPCGLNRVVNHKNFDKSDNRLENLEVISQRENTNQKHLNNTSKYTGVCKRKGSSLWRSVIRVNGKQLELGMFKTEIEAHKAYEEKLKSIKKCN